MFIYFFFFGICSYSVTSDILTTIIFYVETEFHSKIKYL